LNVTVVGAGIMGCAAAWRLSARGHAVMVREQFHDGHKLGSSHGESRVIRKAYFEHPDYVPLLEAAYDGWAELEGQASSPFFDRCGGVFLGRPEGVLVDGCVRSAQTHGLDHEVWSFAQVKDRYPGMDPDEDMVGFWDPAAGVLRADVARAEMRAAAERLGATFEFGSNLATDGPTVCTPGPWALRVLAELNLPLTVTRQVVAWAPIKDGVRLPTWAVETPEETYFYGFPELEGAGEAKLASHAKGPVFDPTFAARDTSSADDAELAPVFPYLLGLESTVSRRQMCLYTNTPDDHFVIDSLPGGDGVYAAGFSGHGFKFAPVIGEILADFLEFGETPHPIGFLRNFAGRW